MQVYIYATEGKYQGLHGINWCGVVDIDSIEEANEWGYEKAIDLISSYDLEEEYKDSEMEEEFYWEVHKIRSDIHMTTIELDKIAARYDRDTFIEEYCEEESVGSNERCKNCYWC